MMKRFLIKYFTFSRGERNGVIALITIIILLLVVRISLPYVVEQKLTFNSEFEKQIKAIELALLYNDTLNSQSDKSNVQQLYNKPRELFYFDPNTLSIEGWHKLGLESRQIRTIKNYLDKGGRFSKKEDLKKIYGLSHKDYKRLQTYIIINKEISREQQRSFTNAEGLSTESNNFRIELNSADSIELLKLKGIGPVFASRIIKYRNLLGGYCKLDQLLEVYSFTPDILNIIIDNIYIDHSKIVTIPVNSVKYPELVRHPYLNNYDANAILTYRKQVGKIIEINELVVNKIVSREVYEKLLPYLSLE